MGELYRGEHGVIYTAHSEGCRIRGGVGTQPILDVLDRIADESPEFQSDVNQNKKVLGEHWTKTEELFTEGGLLTVQGVMRPTVSLDRIKEILEQERLMILLGSEWQKNHRIDFSKAGFHNSEHIMLIGTRLRDVVTVDMNQSGKMWLGVETNDRHISGFHYVTEGLGASLLKRFNRQDPFPKQFFAHEAVSIQKIYDMARLNPDRQIRYP